MAIEFTTPVGRLVQGHPMVRKVVRDRKTGSPKLSKSGEPMQEIFFAIAIPKNGETHWNQTEWGQKIDAQAKADWPNGAWQRPDFAWKIVDGDSSVPNKANKIPNQREGFPGHWVVSTKTLFEGVRCFHAGRYEPWQVIQDKKEIKCGDYVRAVLSIKGNGPDSESPGIYINPELFELTRAGVEIISDDGPDAAAAFGGIAPQLPAGAQIDTGVQPDHEFVNGTTAPPPPAATTAPPPPAHVMLPAAGGTTYEAYIAAGWTDELLIQHGMMQA